MIVDQNKRLASSIGTLQSMATNVRLQTITLWFSSNIIAMGYISCDSVEVSSSTEPILATDGVHSELAGLSLARMGGCSFGSARTTLKRRIINKGPSRNNYGSIDAFQAHFEAKNCKGGIN